jgi:hypothetical protein
MVFSFKLFNFPVSAGTMQAEGRDWHLKQKKLNHVFTQLSRIDVPFSLCDF